MSLFPGIRGLVKRCVGRSVRSRKVFRVEVENKIGLEIGGPSAPFRESGELPLYPWVGGLDNCVFSSETIWEGKRSEGRTFLYDSRKPNGFNFIREATDLRNIADATYDFILSSHSLEHTANPIKALKEWMRVTKPGGVIIILLPYYRYTFDHGRKPTTVQHMAKDYECGTDERDMTHLDEILRFHDLSRDPQAGAAEQFRSRSLKNYDNRCLHHHVFDEHNSRELLEAAGLTVEIVELTKPFHIAILSRCPTVRG